MIVRVNWQPECPNANLVTPDGTNKPDFGGKLDWGTAVTSTTHFHEFENDICPEWCPDATNNECDPATYKIICTEQGSIDPYQDPSAYNI